MMIRLRLLCAALVVGFALSAEAGGSVFEWEACFAFDVYLQEGSTGVNPGDGSESHVRGDFAYSIPLGVGHPWVLRTDHGSYTNYKVDDAATGRTTHDDLELNIFYDESDPHRVDIVRASGSYSWSVTRCFIFDFTVDGNVIVTDWTGMDNATDRTNHYGESIHLGVPEPASLALLALGGLGLLARRKRTPNRARRSRL